jgi:hypothetical protein
MTAPDGGPGGTSPAAMLVDAIGRVALVENRVMLLSSDLAEIGAGQDDLKNGVTALQGVLFRLQDSVDALTAAPADADDETALVDWSNLDRDEAEAEWARLYTWLETVLVPTYRVELVQLQPCWTHHPAVREELSWLRCCWFQAYRRPGSSGSAAGEWHTRWLPGALDRIAGHFKRAECNLGKHEGATLPEHIRQASGNTLSTRALWLDDGRLDDIANRPLPEED